MKQDLLPCATCPWRINRGADTIPHYSQEKALALRNTVGAEDGFRTIMACHHSTVDEPSSCRGYLAKIGWTNLNVRMLAAKGIVPNPNHVLMACQHAGIQLHRNYGEMMDKLTLSYERGGGVAGAIPATRTKFLCLKLNASELYCRGCLSPRGNDSCFQQNETTARLEAEYQATNGKKRKHITQKGHVWEATSKKH